MPLRSLQTIRIWLTRSIYLGLLLALIFVLLFFMSISMIRAHYDDTTSAVKDCAVVFGAAVWRDNVPSHALYDRTQTASDLYKNQQVSCIVLSGGSSTYGAHEVDVMQKVLAENGIPKSSMVFDRDGINTLATIASLDPARSYIMVSNDFHLARIALLAERSEITDYALHEATYHSGRYFRESYFVFREIFANIFYMLHLDRIAR